MTPDKDDRYDPVPPIPSYDEAVATGSGAFDGPDPLSPMGEDYNPDHESRSLLRLRILTTLVDAKATLDPFLASPAGSTVPAPRPSNLRIAQDRGRLKWDGTGRSVGQAPRVEVCLLIRVGCRHTG